jgi:tRNA-splicing ligase RtcB
MDSNHVEQTVPGGVPLKMWIRVVRLEDEATRHLMNAARLPIVFKHSAALPDVHFGIGAAVGSVIATQRAIIPAAVGVDIGCCMMAAKTTLKAEDLPDNLGPMRSSIERVVPHGRSAGRAPGARDAAAWGKVPGSADTAWAQLEPGFSELFRDYPSWRRRTTAPISGLWEAAINSSRSALTKPGSSGSCCTRVRAAWGTRSARCSSNSPSKTRCAAT